MVDNDTRIDRVVGSGTFYDMVGADQVSSEFVPFLREQIPSLGLEHENAIELYYSAALTPRLNVTADLQIIDPRSGRPWDRTGRSRMSTRRWWQACASIRGSEQRSTSSVSGSNAVVR